MKLVKSHPVKASPADLLMGEADAKTGSVEHIVSELVRGLHEGRYVPGQKLVEGDLVRKFGVGRGSVREALRRLEAEGMITSSLHRGASIRVFTRDDIRDLIEVTENLAGFAARLAAERLASTKDTDELRNVVKALSREADDGNPYEVARLRYRFLGELVRLAKNGELAHLLPRFDGSVIRAQFRSAFTSDKARQDVEHYQRILDAIATKDADKAERLMKAFIRRAGAAIQQLPDDHFDSG